MSRRATTDDLTSGRPRAGAGRMPSRLKGRVVVPPMDPNDGMSVKAVNYSGLYDFDVPPGQWMPRPDRLPTSGDVCLIVLDDEEDAWVPAWG